MNREDQEKLKRHRHLIAALIDASIGYFTPLMAAQAIEAHRKKLTYYCEWYIDIASKRQRNGNITDGEELFLAINRDVIRQAFRHRHRSGYQRVLPIVDRNIAGQESIGASWF